MPFQPVPQAVQMDVRYIWDSQQVQNSFNFRVPSDVSSGDCIPIGLGVINAFSSNCIALTATNCRLIGTHFTDLSAADGFSRDVPALPNVPGGSATASLPNNVTQAIHLSTEVRGKSGSGRFYPPGIVEGVVDGNQVQSIWGEAWIGFIDDVRSVALDNGWELVVVSRYANKVKRETGVTYSVTGFSVRDNIVDSQRRRLPGRGR